MAGLERGAWPQHRSRILALAGLLVSLAVSAPAQEPPPPKTAAQPAAPASARLPVPPEAALEDSLKDLRKTLKDDYSKKVAERAELARKLLKNGRETKDDPIFQFAALQEARDVGSAAGDIETAFAAVEALAGTFDVDGAGMRAGVLGAASKAALTPEDAEKAVNIGLGVLDQLGKSLQYETASKLLAPLDAIARGSKNAELTRAVQVRTAELKSQMAEYAKVKPHFDKLKDSPDDPDANLAVAKYYVASKSDWQGVLPLLLKCAEPALKVAAAKELEKPADAAAKAELGDKWWACAENQAGPFKQALQERAASWYTQALGELTGLPKVTAQNRIQAVTNAPASSAGGGLSLSSPKDGKIREFKIEDEVRGVCFHPNGKQGLVVGLAGLHLYDLETGKEAIKTLATPAAALYWCFSPDGRRLVAAGVWGTGTSAGAKVWDVTTGELQAHFTPSAATKLGKFIVRGVTFFPDGRAMVLGYYYEKELLEIIQIQDGKAVGKLSTYTGVAIWSSDGSTLLHGYSPSSSSYSGPRYHWLRVLDGRTGRELREFKDMSGVTGVELYGLSRNGVLAFGSGDGVEPSSSLKDCSSSLKLFDVAGGRLVYNIQYEPDKKRGEIKQVVLFPDNRHVAAGCSTGKIVIIDVAAGKVVKEFMGEAGLWHIDVSPDSKLLLVGGEKTIRLFGVAH